SGKPLPSTYYSKVFEDSRGNIWLGTAVGIEIIKPDGNVRLLREGVTNGGLSNNLVTDILEERYGRIWISTQRGINIVEDSTIRWITKTQGLIDEVVVDLVEDDDGNIWAATEKGMSRIWVREGFDDIFVNNFSKSDGLQSLSFNENAGYKLRNGDLIFGGPNGFNLIDVKSIHDEMKSFKFGVSQVQLNGSKLASSGVVRQTPTTLNNIDSSLNLAYDENTLVVRLTDFDYLGNNRGIFQYFIKGLNEQWIDLDPSQFTIYLSNLLPADYEILGRYVSNHGVAGAEYSLMKFVVHPPWWKTKV